MRMPFYTVFLFILIGNQIMAQEEMGCNIAGCHADLITKVYIHAVASDDCLNCHEGDLTKHPVIKGKEFNLIDEVPDLCFSCHDDFSSENLKLHSPVKNGKCTTCHSPHSSNNNSLLLKDERSTCLNCHNKEIKLENRIIKNIADKIINEDLTHPPVMDGCITCHKPHASEFPHLLNDNFPKGNYASTFEGSYYLCFTCHDESAFTEQLTIKDTGFRDGSTNLHFLHVNREKSRSCINCHDVHGSQNEHFIAEDFSYGNTSLKLNHKVTEVGGSCSPGCHNEKMYSR